MRIVRRVLNILVEGNRMGNFHRNWMDVDTDAERGQTALILAVEIGNGLGAERSRKAGASAGYKFQLVAYEIKGDFRNSDP